MSSLNAYLFVEKLRTFSFLLDITPLAWNYEFEPGTAFPTRLHISYKTACGPCVGRSVSAV